MGEFVKVLLPVIVSLLIVIVAWMGTYLIGWWISLYREFMDRAVARRLAEQIGIAYVESMNKTADKNNGGGSYQI